MWGTATSSKRSASSCNAARISRPRIAWPCPVTTFITARCNAANFVEVEDDEFAWPFAELIAMLRRALAYAGVTGRMAFDTSWLELDEDREAAIEAVNQLSDAEKTITMEDVTLP